VVNWEDMWVESTDRMLLIAEENESLERQLRIAVDFIKEIKTFQSDLILREIEKTRLDGEKRSKEIRVRKRVIPDD
jgi:hypothetical protein